MKESTIGIKIANGSYFPVLNENSKGKKKLILTTVKDNQSSVQIDLYKGAGKEITDALYIGSLVIEKIENAERGNPEIELILGVDKDGNLNASAADTKTGDRQSLSISLTTLSEDSTYDIPDFDLSDTPAPPEDFDFDAGDSVEGGMEEEGFGGPSLEESADTDSEEEYAGKPKKERGSVNPFLLAGFVILGLAIVALVILLLFKVLQGPAAPPLEAGGKTEVAKTVKPEPAKPAVSAEKPVEPPKAEAAPAAAEKPAAEQPAVKSPAAPSPAAQASGASNGLLSYRILWGDTLWWLAWKFYKDPWQYRKIAEANKIANPDRIIAGTNILIPQK